MGFKATDFTTVSATGPTVLIPSNKDVVCKVFTTTRSDTAANILKAVLPADASILEVLFYGSVVSNAATTATVTITVSNAGGTISTGTVDVKTNGATNALVNMTNLPNVEPLPLNGDLKIVAQYAETGTASTAGGPWNFVVNYVR